MPPRIPGSSPSLATAVDATLGQLPTRAVRSFTTTQPQERMSNNRQRMRQWLNRQGSAAFKNPTGAPNYAGQTTNQPFPLNPLFKSEQVLSDQLREVIWTKVVQQGEALKAVSHEFGIDVRRVAAVVRLKEVEKKMVEKNQPLATAYSTAVNRMLPTRQADEHIHSKQPFEPINDIPMHSYTSPQLFVPVSESRHFTRNDAAAAFHDNLLPADKRSYQKELIDAERAVADGKDPEEALAEYRATVQRVEEDHAAKVAARLEAEAERTTTYGTRRATFRIKDIRANDVGEDGKSHRGVGWRYGAPHQDRKRGLIKIPTQVP